MEKGTRTWQNCSCERAPLNPAWVLVEDNGITHLGLAESLCLSISYRCVFYSTKLIASHRRKVATSECQGPPLKAPRSMEKSGVSEDCVAQSDPGEN